MKIEVIVDFEIHRHTDRRCDHFVILDNWAHASFYSVSQIVCFAIRRSKL